MKLKEKYKKIKEKIGKYMYFNLNQGWPKFFKDS